MFDQSFFDNLLTTVTRVNKTWRKFAGEDLINLASANIITRDGATYAVRYNFGRLADNDNILHVAAHDVETDTSRLVCIPFSAIERVEVFDGKPEIGGKRIRFETAETPEV
jgi:hypothetical protein